MHTAEARIALGVLAGSGLVTQMGEGERLDRMGTMAAPGFDLQLSKQRSKLSRSVGALGKALTGCVA